PQQAMHGRPALLRALCPLPSFNRLADRGRDLFQVSFFLVQQAVQVHTRVMMRADAKRTVAERYVIAGGTHGTVALVIFGSEAETRRRLALFRRRASMRLFHLQFRHPAAQLNAVLWPGIRQLIGAFPG